MHQDTELIVLSGAWPSEHIGYGFAVAATLRQYLKVFPRVHFLALVDDELTDAAAWSQSPVDWIHIPVSRRPKWLRFLLSVPRRLPACTMLYSPATALVCRRVLEIHAAAGRQGRRVALVFEGIPLACTLPAIRKRLPGVPAALRSLDVLLNAFEGCQHEGSLVTRLSWRLEMAKIRRFEQATCRLADRLWPITEDNAADYVRRHGVRADGVLGVSLDTTRYAGVAAGDPRTVVFLGGADMRTAKSLAGFVQSAWPAVRSQVPEARLILGGRDTDRFADPSQAVEGLGFVADDRTLLAKGLIYANPQQIGSGVKLKSIVAMLSGKALVATPVGADGLGGVDGEHYFIAPDHQAMAARIVALLKDRQLALRVGQKARALATCRYSEEAMTRSALPLLEDFALARTG